MRTRLASSRRARTPNCTHVVMDRVYGRDQMCSLCGRTPALGFLYQCRQDHPKSLLPYVSVLQNSDEMEGDSEAGLRLKLEEAGVSESIIRNAEQGGYTDAQLDKIISQKQHIKQVITDALRGPSNNDGASNSTNSIQAIASICALGVCHSCRPYYRDRVYIPVGAVVSNELPPLTLSDLERLPVKSAHVMSSIGLETLPTAQDPVSGTLSTFFSTNTTQDVSSQASTLTFRTTQSDLDYITIRRRIRRRLFKLGRSSSEILRDIAQNPTLFSRQGLKSAIKAIFSTSRVSSPSGSSITLPVPRTGTVRKIADSTGMEISDFDVRALRRIRRQKERNEMRTGTYKGGFEGVNAGPTVTPRYEIAVTDDEDEDTGSDHISIYSSASEGSEVEVTGGVALTEEAVETHTPDILNTPTSTSDLARISVPVSTPVLDQQSILKNGARVELLGDEDEDEEGGQALESIMTQV